MADDLLVTPKSTIFKAPEGRSFILNQSFKIWQTLILRSERKRKHYCKKFQRSLAQIHVWDFGK